MAGATAALNNEDHSLTPNTSEMSSCDKNIIEIARSLTLDYISYRLRSKLEQSKLQGLPRHFLIPPQSPTNVLTSTLRKLATDTEAKYPDLFESVCKKLDITPVSAYRTFVCVAQEIFQEETNWGRIVALYVFGGVVAHHFVETQRPEMVQKIVEWTVSFIARNLLTWIRENGGWVSRNSEFFKFILLFFIYSILFLLFFDIFLFISPTSCILVVICWMQISVYIYIDYEWDIHLFCQCLVYSRVSNCWHVVF